jgi:hypothetical protein
MSSSDALPITPSRFATALPDLPVSALHLKVLELRNSIAHLDYSNEQLRPFAEGTATTTTTTTSSQPQQESSSPSTEEAAQTGDADCADAIRENEQVIGRMQERIRLVRAEVERRGLSWAEFQSEAEREEEAAAAAAAGDSDEKTGTDINTNTNGGGSGEADAEGVNGVVNGAGAGGRHSAWTDGTFQTGVISGGVVSMDGVVGSRQGQGQGQALGGSLTDEELRRRMEEQMRGLGGEDEDEGGLHL